MKKRNTSVRLSAVAIIMLITVGCYFSDAVYAGQFASQIQKKQSVPEWAIIIGIVVAIINVIVFVCKMGDDGGSWKRHALRQQQIQQQQEQQRLFQEECDRQERAFQKEQWRFQEEQVWNQWQDFNRFNDFHQF